MSYKFRQVIPTLTERFVIIILAYCVERWVFIHIDVPLSYIAAGVVCAEQMLSIAENKASCRLPGDKHARVWKLLAKVLIDKTARHFDVDNSILDDDLQHIEAGETVIEKPKKNRRKKIIDYNVKAGITLEDIEPSNEEL
jgi:hypothetical protein